MRAADDFRRIKAEMGRIQRGESDDIATTAKKLETLKPLFPDELQTDFGLMDSPDVREIRKKYNLG